MLHHVKLKLPDCGEDGLPVAVVVAVAEEVHCSFLEKLREAF